MNSPLPKDTLPKGSRRRNSSPFYRAKWKKSIRLITKQNKQPKTSRRNTEKGPISSVDNIPILPSLYEDKMRRLVQLKPPLATNRVHIPWYRRYLDVIPDKDQQHTFQPYREIQARDEDIALQHQYGYHDCMTEYNLARSSSRYQPLDCKSIREASMARYNRIKKRDEQKEKKKDRDGPQQDDSALPMPGQEIDLTTEFGFSANKRKVVLPVVEFLCKLHINREREVFKHALSSNSKWKLFSNAEFMEKLEAARKLHKRMLARTRIRRLFNLVLCVDRFIKCVAMIAGDTQTLLKDTTLRSETRVPAVKDPGDNRPEKELAIFNVHNYVKVGQVQVPFHIQMILSKPWFCRTNKEVETAVRFLEKMRCFTAYPRPFQFMLARVAWYLELPTQKVIIRQSQQAVNFYLLLNGSVRVDRLEGSPCDAEDGYFKTMKILSSQDMFGDECVTQPFSERWYTATTEEKCAALDFNMHDYNNMIQTANTSEEAPDHIRFLCKLRIMDNFPKIKLLQEQDNNVTYFFFRPGTLVCQSVRDSPYVFVIRNGSCSTIQELKPKIYPHRKSTLAVVSEEARTRRRSTVTSLYNIYESDRRGSKSEKRNPNIKRTSVIDDIKGRFSETDKNWFDKTQSSFERSKVGFSESIRTIRDKTASVTKTMSSAELKNFNLDRPTRKDSIITRSSDVLSSRGSSLRWKVEGTFPVTNPEDSVVEDRQLGSFKRTSSSRGSLSELSRRRSKIVGTNITLTPEKIVADSAVALAVLAANTNNSAGGKWPQCPAPPTASRVSLSKGILEGKTHPSRPSAVSRRHRMKGRDEAEPVAKHHSQWTQKALLTVTDVTGVEWLDYNDGTYNPPLEDVSLVSHGATIIMIKKDFMLKYLKRVW